MQQAIIYINDDVIAAAYVWLSASMFYELPMWNYLEDAIYMAYPFPKVNDATAYVWQWIQITVHNSLCMWLLIYAGIDFNPC